MAENPLRRLESLGQSIWLDFISRDVIASGQLAKLISEDGLRGVTSNPAIFQKAITHSDAYDDLIGTLARADQPVEAIYEALTVRDVQDATDCFHEVFTRTDGGDGYVSLEVSPRLAHDTEGTIAEAHRLWAKVDRANAFIKVPATRAGLPAIKQLISEGINVNVTLLFGLPRYAEVAEAYIGGLEARAARGEPVDHVASVASFFLSRIDVLLDPILEKQAAALVGETAIASAKVAYQMYKEIIAGDRFRSLAAKGAHPQRLLWASTSTKNPAFSDVKYVEALIGPATVNTLPLETINAYRDHGDPARRLEDGVDAARDVLKQLAAAGIDIDQVTQQLEDEGVKKFVDPFDSLLAALEAQRVAALGK